MKQAALRLTLVLASLTAFSAAPPVAPRNVRITRFVAPDGSAANDGITTNTPWSLSYALGQAGPSNVLVLLPGTYPSIEVSQPGTSLRSQTRWGARVLGSPGTHGIWTDNQVGDVTIDGVEVANSTIDGISLSGTNSTVRNCWVHDSSGQGISATPEPGTLIERNLIERNGTAPGGACGIGLSGTNCIVRGNVVRYNQGWGCQLYSEPPFSSAECRFYDNLIYGNGAGLMVRSPVGQTNHVVNNTVVAPTNFCILADYGILAVTNNILVGGGVVPLITLADGATVLTDHNVVSAASSPAGAHDVVVASPGFVNAAAGLYWLTAASPARGAADPAVIPPVSFFGYLQSSITDVGAFQYDGLLASDTRLLDPSGGQGADYWALTGSILAPPSITVQPQDQAVMAGQGATFTVTATGSAPLNYQWSFNGSNVGSNTNAYTRPNCAQADNGGVAQVTVSNGRGSLPSRAATLTVNPPGTTYYVAVNGSSANTGLTTDSPWSLSYALKKLGPGITLVLLPGVYSGPVIIYNVKGTAQNPMVIRSQVKWKAVIANSNGAGIGLGFTPYVGYCVLDGLCITNSASDGIDLAGYNCTVRNCWVTGNHMQGINASNVTCSNNVVEFNLIENNATVRDIYHHGMYVSGPNNIIRGNVVRYNNLGYGIHVYSGNAGEWMNNNRVYNNLTYGHTSTYGITVYGANGNNGTNPGTNFIFCNTILDGMKLRYGGVGVSNNIVLPSPSSPSQPIWYTPLNTPVVSADYNLSTLKLDKPGAHDVVSAPGLVNTNNGLAWLTSGSLARNAAAAGVCGPVDFFGAKQSSATDIGAFQYSPTLASDGRVLYPSGANPDYWSSP